jgi:hypothetical protein
MLVEGMVEVSEWRDCGGMIWDEMLSWWVSKKVDGSFGLDFEMIWAGFREVLGIFGTSEVFF